MPLGGTIGGRRVPRTKRNFGWREDGERVNLRDETEAGGLREVFAETFEILCVQGVIDVGAEIKGEFFFGESEFAGRFCADFGEMRESVGE